MKNISKNALNSLCVTMVIVVLAGSKTNICIFFNKYILFPDKGVKSGAGALEAKEQESIRSIRSIRSIKSMDPAGALLMAAGAARFKSLKDFATLGTFDSFLRGALLAAAGAAES